jgi:hypothetical protein
VRALVFFMTSTGAQPTAAPASGGTAGIEGEVVGGTAPAASQGSTGATASGGPEVLAGDGSQYFQTPESESCRAPLE